MKFSFVIGHWSFDFPKSLSFFIVVLIFGSSNNVVAQQTSEKNAEPTTRQSQQSKLGTVKPAKLGNTKNVHTCGDLFLAGQFAVDDLKLMKEKGFKRIITLRTEGEITWDEKAKVEEAGMKFVEVPFRAPEQLTDEVFDKIRMLLADKETTTLFHCGSANRVGGVWLPYRVLDEGVELKTALVEAKEIGLRTKFIEEKAIDYIERTQAIREKMAKDGVNAANGVAKVTEKRVVRNGEESVKPGINTRFLSDEMKVEDFVKRFEVESREVFSARNEVLRATGIKPGDRVVDIGAGTGLYTRMFAATVGDKGWVYAVDISPKMIKHINDQAARDKAENITSVLCQEDSVNLPPESVDVAFVCDTYHHFEFPKSTLASIHKALKPGGRLIVIDFERIEGKTREWLMNHVRAGKDVFQKEIVDSGFKFDKEVRIGGFAENYFLQFSKQK